MHNQNPNLREYLAKLTRHINSLPSSERVDGLDKAIAQMQAQLADIQQRLDSVVADIPNQIDETVQKQMSKITQLNSIARNFPDSTSQSQPWKCVTTLSAHRGGVNSVASSLNGEIVVSVGQDNTLKVWHLKTGELILTAAVLQFLACKREFQVA